MMNRIQIDDAPKEGEEVVAIREVVLDVVAGAIEEGVAVAEVAVGTETSEWAVVVGVEEAEEGEANISRVKVHRRPAEEVEQKEAELMPVVAQVMVVVPTSQLLPQLDSKTRMVVKTNLHLNPSDVVVVGAGGQEEGVATGEDAVVVPEAALHRNQKERQMLLPLKREVRSRRPAGL